MDALQVLLAAPPGVRTAALALFDEVSAPLSPRQLAAAFRSQRLGQIEARRLARMLSRIDIIAVLPVIPEHLPYPIFASDR